MRQTQFQLIHFTGEGFRTLTVYRAFLKQALVEQREAREAYEADVRDWYENGDGRPPHWVSDVQGSQRWNEGGQGHRYPVCIHGASLWVDHDIPCGACEMGESEIALAIGYARERFLRFVARWEWATKAPGDLPYETRNELMEWAASLYPGWKKATR